MAINFQTATRRAPTQADLGLAVSQIGFIPRNNTVQAAVQQAALRAGMTSVGPGQFQHSDGSFIAVVNNRVERGVARGGRVDVFSQVPSAQTVGAAAQPAPNNGGQYTSLPSNSWAWYQQNTALGRLPILNQGYAAAQTTLQQHGFQRTGTGNPERWTNPNCGSWVNLYTTGQVQLGWQRWTLGQLPYNNRTSRP